MFKYVKLEDKKAISVGEGDNIELFKSLGMTLEDVEQSDVDFCYYLVGYAPMKSDEQKALEEKERIAKLFLTAADVERGIYKAKDMDFDDIVAMLETNPPQGLDIKALKIELKANNFYRGNPYVEAVGKILGFTDKQLTRFFETNDYKELLYADTTEPTIIPDEVSKEGV